jgi:hypothetical protein
MHCYPLCPQFFQDSQTQNQRFILCHIICTIKGEFVQVDFCAYLGRTYPHTGPCSFLSNNSVEAHVPHLILHVIPRVCAFCSSSHGFIIESHDNYLLDTLTTLRGGGEQCRALFPKTSPSENSLISNHHLLITYFFHL